MTTLQFMSIYRWPIGIIIFFFALSVHHGRMLLLALEGRPEMITEQPYELGLRFEEVIEKQRQAAAMQLEARTVIRKLGTQRLVELNLLTAGKPFSGKSVAISLKHPTSREYDVTLPIVEERQGSYRAAFSAELDGLWLVDILVETQASERALLRTQVLQQQSHRPVSK